MTWRLQFFFLQKPQLEKVHSLNLQQQAPRKWVETEAHFESIRSNVLVLSYLSYKLFVGYTPISEGHGQISCDQLKVNFG